MTNTFNAAVQDDAAAFSRSEYCHRDRGRSRFRLTVFHRTRRPPPPGYGHPTFLLVCFPGKAEEWVRCCGKWETIVWCCVKSDISVQKNLLKSDNQPWSYSRKYLGNFFL